MPTKKEKNIDIGARLTEFRKAKALSGGQLAEIIGRTRQTWSGYESGSVEPPLSVLSTLVKECRLNLNWLLTGEDVMFLPGANRLTVKPRGSNRDSCAELEAEIKEERRLNRQLTERLLVLTDMIKLEGDNAE